MDEPRPGTTGTCRNCGGAIVVVNYALGPEWRHTQPGANDPDHHRHCRVTVAEPE